MERVTGLRDCLFRPCVSFYVLPPGETSGNPFPDSRHFIRCREVFLTMFPQLGDTESDMCAR